MTGKADGHEAPTKINWNVYFSHARHVTIFWYTFVNNLEILNLDFYIRNIYAADVTVVFHSSVTASGRLKYMPLAKETYLGILLIACFHVIEMTILLDIFDVAVEQTCTVSNITYV